MGLIAPMIPKYLLHSHLSTLILFSNFVVLEIYPTSHLDSKSSDLFYFLFDHVLCT